MGFKRRRGIGLRRWLVTALKEYATREGVSSHTAAVNRILRGKLAPIRDYERYKENGDHSKRDVSMPEELWLALKDYGERRGKLESQVKVASKILVGKIGPIPPESLEEGRCRARKREAAREREAMGNVDEDSPTASQEEIILQERAENLKNRQSLSQGVPVTEGVSERKIDPDDDSYGGIFNF